MYIVVVEDDYLQSDWICAKLGQAFPLSNIQGIGTEFEFRYRLEYIASNPPDVIVMDIMLPWTVPTENMQRPPDDVLRGGFHRAGLRCERLLAERESTKDIPVILFTVLDRADLESELQDRLQNIVYLSKESDPEKLVRLIRELTGSRQQKRG